MARADKKILIVDDEPDILSYLDAYLEDEGYQTCSAGDSQRALLALRQERPDLVLMDIKMPNETGLQLYRAMLADERLRGIPVIFVTGLAEFDLFSDACDPLPRPAACVSKPVDLLLLSRVVQEALAEVPKSPVS